MKKIYKCSFFIFFIPTHLFSIDKKETIYGIELISSSIVSTFFSIPMEKLISKVIYKGIFNREPTVIEDMLPYFICAPLGATIGTHFTGNILLNQVGTKFDYTHKIAIIGGIVGFALVGSASSIYSFIKKESPLNGFIFGAKIGCIIGSSIGSVIGYNK